MGIKTRKSRRKNKIRLLIILYLFFNLVYATFADEGVVYPKEIEVNQITEISVSLKKSELKINATTNIFSISSNKELEVISQKIIETDTHININFEVIFKSVGAYTINILHNNIQIPDLQFEIFVVNKELSENTHFFWKIFDTGLEVQKNDLIQGKKYTFQLCGNFNFLNSSIKDIEHTSGTNIIITKTNNQMYTKDFLSYILSIEAQMLFFDTISLPEVKITYTDKMNTSKEISINAQEFMLSSNELIDIDTQIDNQEKKIESNILTEHLQITDKAQMTQIIKMHELASQLSNQFSIKEYISLLKLEKQYNDGHIVFFFPKTYIIIFNVMLITLILLFIFLTKKYKVIQLISICIGILLIITSLIISNTTLRTKIIIFPYQQTALRQIPDEKSDILDFVDAGRLATINGETEYWVSIKIDKKIGWIKKSECLIIK